MSTEHSTPNASPSTNRFDAIVVGAGPAGSSASFTLARKGFKVLMIDRGRRAGTKNMYGGRVYSEPLEAIFPSLRKDAPVHRWVKAERLSFVSDEGLTSIEYRGGESKSFTTYLPELVNWMRAKAEEAGALVATEVRVDRLVVEKEKVIGVQAGPDTVYADTVIDAEGVNRLLLEGAWQMNVPRQEDLAIGLKETIKLDAERVNQRFGLEDEGMAWILLGSVTRYIPGGAFVYTNRDSVSIGLVLFLSHAVKRTNGHISRLLEDFRLHPKLKHLWRDGELLEYSAKLVPEYWRGFMPRRLSGAGLLVVGDAAGVLLNNGMTIRGVDLAAYSGYLAAETFTKAHAEGDFTSEMLSAYGRRVEESFIGRELRKHNGLEYIRRNPHFFDQYPRLVNSGLGRIFNIGLESPTIWKALRGAQKDVGPDAWTAIKDMYKIGRTL
ncbi:MAG TPA: FAD-dependent oxidoreductase [Candidatus Bathyarchaeia archaeon]|nr:MAG: hypothetical protein A3K70_04585 [Candidatus Bathyarchaeota archaeon RBG_16_48_13]HJX23641.1 FAD-dependent oxidoreductase [Candidatus Bathyarchaeia archaeon]